MTFSSDDRGGPDDVVRIKLNGDETFKPQSYEVRSSILEQPSTFSVRLGHDGVASEILDRFQPNTDFELYVGDHLQHSGTLDGPEIHGDEGTFIDFHGRDSMKALHDTFVESESHIEDETYRKLIETNLIETLGDDWTLEISNASNRAVSAGVKMPLFNEPRSVDEVIIEKNDRGIVEHAVQSHLGERRLEFIRRHLDRAGLFLWSGAAKNQFILGAPNPDQPPIYELHRTLSGSNCSLEAYRNHGSPPRYSKVVVYSRKGTKKQGRGIITGQAIDDEMIDWGITTVLSVRDANVANKFMATRHAERKLAEGRRVGYQLSYRVAGHTTQSLMGGRAVWIPDTVVKVNDELLGVTGNFWIEEVIRRRGDSGEGTTTILSLMRVADVIFGGLDDA